jgi:ethanolamine ammonia-lyase small subunit
VLSPESAAKLVKGSYDASFVIADGLSALAVHRHAGHLWSEVRVLLERESWHLAPLSVVLQGRVAVGDQIGRLLGAQLVVVLIGERPGLTSPDSLGVYLTWDPRPGRTDAERNCISNIRPEGIGYAEAARKLHFLMSQARARQLSGILLKDNTPISRLDEPRK